MRTRPFNRRGSTLFVVLFFMALLSVFVGAAFSLTSNTSTITNRSTQMTLAYAVADGAMELVYSRWRSIMAFRTDRNLNARVFIKADSVNNSESRDITVVTLADLGLPPGYLGLTSNANDPIATITIHSVDASGREFGNYSNGRCTDSDTQYVEAVNRTGYDASSNNFYPPPASPDYNFRVSSQSGSGFLSVELVYRVDVAVTVSTRASPLVARVRRHFTRSDATGAQFALFYEDRMEVIPGTNTIINGAVHSNKDLWVAKRTNVSVEFKDNVSYVDALVLNQNPAGSSGTSADFTDITPTTASVFGTGAPSQSSPLAVGGIDRSFLKPFNNTTGAPNQNASWNNNSLREIIESPTTKSSVDPYSGVDPRTVDYDQYWDTDTQTNSNQRAIESARLYRSADLKVLLAFRPDGTVDPAKTIIRGRTPDGKADGEDLKSSTLGQNILNLVVGTRVDVTDRRESTNGDTVKATEIDMAQLKNAMESFFFNGGSIATGYESYRGQVYIADVTYNPSSGSYNPYAYATAPGTFETNGAGTVKHALLLKNGENLPGAVATSETYRNFTLATSNGVYIQGDYNTGARGNAVPSNTTADGATSVGDTVTSAVMADAVTVVSNRFVPANAAKEINELQLDTNGVPVTTTDASGNVVNVLARGATSTTVNTGIVTGQYQSNDYGFSGGSTNIIRFLENWTSPVSQSVALNAQGVPIYSGDATLNRFTYRGSVMQSYTSQEFRNKFLSPGPNKVYSPPSRRVDFEQKFLDKAPSGFPGTISYTKGNWERPNS